MDTVAQWDAEQERGEGSISANLKPPSNSYALRQPELKFRMPANRIIDRGNRARPN